MIYRYDLYNPSRKACLDHAATFVDAFSNEYFLSIMFPQWFGAPKSPEVLAMRAAMSKSWARQQHLRLLSGKSVLFNLYMDDNCVATAFYSLPASKVPRRSLWQSLKYRFYLAWYGLLEWLDGYPLKQHMDSAQSKEWFGQWTFEAEDDFEALAAMTPTQLAKERYPQEELVWLGVLAVAQGNQGKGYGGQLLLDSVKDFKGTTVFKHESARAEGPTKVGLFPTRGNDSFYRRYGFETVLTKELDFRGEPFKHQMMQAVA